MRLKENSRIFNFSGSLKILLPFLQDLCNVLSVSKNTDINLIHEILLTGQATGPHNS